MTDIVEKIFAPVTVGDERPSWDEANTEEFLAAIRAGNSPTQYLRLNAHMPSVGAYNYRRTKDAKFREDVEIAREIGMEVRIDEALDHQYAVRTDKALSIAAQKYSNVAIAAAAAMCPKRFGQMVRHADADGGKLTVQLVRYSDLPPIDAEFSEPQKLGHIPTDDVPDTDKSTD